MNDATGGTNADTEALEPQRKTDAFPGEPETDGEPDGAVSRDVEDASLGDTS